MTVSFLTICPPSIDWNVTVPLGRSLSSLRMLPFCRPAFAMSASASSTSSPTSVGTSTSSISGPSETTSVTVWPLVSGSPFAGLVSMT